MDFDIHQRVARLLDTYGPQSEMPLTLRVYGTLLKGFCVLNNERAKALFGDCERLVMAFAQRPFCEDGLRLPPARKQQADALTLDLDLGNVRDSEAFDWAPLEEGALLRLGTQPSEVLDVPLGDAIFNAPSSLETEAARELSFPALDMLMPAQLPDPPALDERSTPAHPGPVPDVPPAPAPEPQLLSEMLAGELVPSLGAPAQEPAPLRRPIRRGRSVARPGHVFGFDEQTTLSHEMYDAWQLDDSDISEVRRGPEEYADLVCRASDQIDRLGALRLLLEPPSELLGADVPSAVPDPPSSEGVRVDADMVEPQRLPDVQGLLASDHIQPEMLSAVFAQPPEGPEFVAAAAAVTHAAPEFQALVPAGDLTELFSISTERSECDVPTAQVGMIVRRVLEDKQRVAFTDLVPLAVDRATAARTFSSLLSLATNGDVVVEQRRAYGPILICAQECA